KYGRRWIGGMFVGWLLLGGAGAGAWFLAPDAVHEQAAELIAQSPNANFKKKAAEKDKGLLDKAAVAEKELRELQDKTAEEKKKVEKEIMVLKEAEKSAKDVRELIKNKLGEKATFKDLTPILRTALAAKQAAEKKYESLAKALEGKLIESADKVEIADVDKAL